ncbi:hypothetical protein K5I29_04415 [Flavobacterium agricola]|uniref:Cytochrome c domain-containing protein n=1 Tax=Flavobacterium agricola TaxID=2870839 RepID=A0ABY6M492_9FLAO|nr:hypothetical protein [Flavobacterium agricola]UYW02151.1 hypothetical protein K5I29_04415 [Flavobacterium agricola]
MKHLLYCTLSLLLFSCQNKSEIKANITTSDSEFVMYEMSEMAGLMEQMYVENKRLRDRIIANDTLGEMPSYFQEILTRTLTDPSDLDQFYRDHALFFLHQQEQIYSKPQQAKQQFNLSIDACIACHEVKCGGPIPRIKKLYIK